MTRIVYKKLLGKHLIDSTVESKGGGISIELSEPIDAKMVIDSYIYPIERGICRLDAATLKEGEICPKAYTGADLIELEAFVYKGGTVHRTGNRDAILSDALHAIDALEKRVAATEKELSELREMVARKITLI